MKKSVKKLSEEDLLETHGIRRSVPGWFFRVEERSANHWEVEGIDLWGRKVRVEGSDPEELLDRAEAEASSIHEEQGSG